MTLGELLAIKGAKAWTCERGHVLGVTVRGRLDGKWKTRLLKFRHAQLEENMQVEPEVDAVVEGTVRAIICDACPNGDRLARTWWEKDRNPHLGGESGFRS